MIIDPDAADGEVLWSLDPAAQAKTNVARFGDFLRHRGLQLDDGYEELWQWSVDEPDQFWSSWADFTGVRLGGDRGRR